MRKWVTISALLHLLVFLLLWLGLPHFPREIQPMQMVSVEIASVADITKPPPQPKPEPPKPEPPKPPPPSPEPPKPELQTPPVKEEKAEPVPKPKPPKPEPPKQQDALSSILKNVAKMKNPEKPPEKTEKTREKPEPESKPEVPPQKEPAPAPATPQVPATATHLNSNELAALQQQMKGCWNVPAGAKDIENTSVDIYLSVNQDRTLREAVIVDQARMGRDAFFRTVAESALRAVLNPRCSPLALPPEKYNEWRETIMTFNPKDMF